ncbi:hypothetical protein [Marinoscillum sp.]
MCAGTGKIISAKPKGYETCPHCSGTGYQYR